jgi:hypothetical protein
MPRRKALADLRSGRLPVLGGGALFTDVLSANVEWSAGPACTDRLRQLNALTLNATSARPNKVLFSLTTGTGQDSLRSACPGPASAEVLGSSGTLARASLPLRALGRSSLHIVVSGHGRFVTGSYAGSRSGSATLALRLVRVRAGTKTETVFPGEP